MTEFRNATKSEFDAAVANAVFTDYAHSHYTGYYAGGNAIKKMFFLNRSREVLGYCYVGPSGQSDWRIPSFAPSDAAPRMPTLADVFFGRGVEAQMRAYLVWDTSRSWREAVRITAASGFDARRAYAESYGVALSKVMARLA